MGPGGRESPTGTHHRVSYPSLLLAAPAHPENAPEQPQPLCASTRGLCPPAHTVVPAWLTQPILGSRPDPALAPVPPRCGGCHDALLGAGGWPLPAYLLPALISSSLVVPGLQGHQEEKQEEAGEDHGPPRSHHAAAAAAATAGCCLQLAWRSTAEQGSVTSQPRWAVPPTSSPQRTPNLHTIAFPCSTECGRSRSGEEWT